MYSLATALLGCTFFMASNVSAMHGGGLAGLFQRPSICLYLLWLAVLALRLSRAANVSRGVGQRASGLGSHAQLPGGGAVTREPVSEPEYRRVHRPSLVAFIVLAPVVLLLGFAWDPELGVPHNTPRPSPPFRRPTP